MGTFRAALKGYCAGLIDISGSPSTYSNVPGVSIIVNWSDLWVPTSPQTAAGATYDFSTITSALANIGSGGFALLRVKAGIQAPAWAKTLSGFTPVQVGVQTVTGTIGKYWDLTGQYHLAYKNFIIALAAAFDGNNKISGVWNTYATCVYSEPFQRAGTAANGLTTWANIQASMGVSGAAAVTLDVAAIVEGAKILNDAFVTTPVETALNVYVGGETALENACVSIKALDTVFGGNKMVFAITNLADPQIDATILNFMQTQTTPSMGQTNAHFTTGSNLLGALDLAIGENFCCCELPGGYKSLVTNAQLQTRNDNLVANSGSSSTPGQLTRSVGICAALNQGGGTPTLADAAIFDWWSVQGGDLKLGTNGQLGTHTVAYYQGATRTDGAGPIRICRYISGVHLAAPTDEYDGIWLPSAAINVNDGTHAGPLPEDWFAHKAGTPGLATRLKSGSGNFTMEPNPAGQSTVTVGAKTYTSWKAYRAQRVAGIMAEAKGYSGVFIDMVGHFGMETGVVKPDGSGAYTTQTWSDIVTPLTAGMYFAAGGGQFTGGGMVIGNCLKDAAHVNTGWDDSIGTTAGVFGAMVEEFLPSYPSFPSGTDSYAANIQMVHDVVVTKGSDCVLLQKLGASGALLDQWQRIGCAICMLGQAAAPDPTLPSVYLSIQKQNFDTTSNTLAPLLIMGNPSGAASTAHGITQRSYDGGVVALNTTGTDYTTWVLPGQSTVAYHEAETPQTVKHGGDQVTVPANSAVFYILNSPSTTPAPTITSLGTTSGDCLGGTSVAINGTNLTAATGVQFGGVDAASFTVNAAGTRITAVTPEIDSTGNAAVTVTTGGGTATSTTQFNFTATTPVISSLSSTSGAAGATHAITITGTGFLQGTTVGVGTTDQATSVSVVTQTSITCTLPSKVAGVYAVTVNNPGGTSNGINFTYTGSGSAPAISGLNHRYGVPTGGQSVVITGSGFTGITGGTSPSTHSLQRLLIGQYSPTTAKLSLLNGDCDNWDIITANPSQYTVGDGSDSDLRLLNHQGASHGFKVLAYVNGGQEQVGISSAYPFWPTSGDLPEGAYLHTASPATSANRVTAVNNNGNRVMNPQSAAWIQFKIAEAQYLMRNSGVLTSGAADIAGLFLDQLTTAFTVDASGGNLYQLNGSTTPIATNPIDPNRRGGTTPYQLADYMADAAALALAIQNAIQPGAAGATVASFGGGAGTAPASYGLSTAGMILGNALSQRTAYNQPSSSIVQRVWGTSTTTTVSFALGTGAGQMVAGNTMVAIVQSNGTISSPSTQSGWTVGPTVSTVGGRHIAVFYRVIVAGDSATITVPIAGASLLNDLHIMELASTGVLDIHATATPAGTVTSISPTTPTTFLDPFELGIAIVVADQAGGLEMSGQTWTAFNESSIDTTRMHTSFLDPMSSVSHPNPVLTWTSGAAHAAAIVIGFRYPLASTADYYMTTPPLSFLAEGYEHEAHGAYGNATISQGNILMIQDASARGAIATVYKLATNTSFTSSATTTFDATHATDTAGTSWTTDQWAGSLATAGGSTGLITHNNTTGQITVGAWSPPLPLPAKNTKFTISETLASAAEIEAHLRIAIAESLIGRSGAYGSVMCGFVANGITDRSNHPSMNVYLGEPTAAATRQDSTGAASPTGNVWVRTFQSGYVAYNSDTTTAATVTLPAGTWVDLDGVLYTSAISLPANTAQVWKTRSVQFGPYNATSYTVDSNTQITAVDPGGWDGQTVDITVCHPTNGVSGKNTNDVYSWASANMPVIFGLSPVTGTTAGGDSVVFTGIHFTGASSVVFGITAASSFSVDSDTQITAVSPAMSKAGSFHTGVVANGLDALNTGPDKFTFTSTGALNSVTLKQAANIQAGDLLLLWAAWDSSTITMSITGDFFISVPAATDGSTCSQQLFYRLVDDSESATEVVQASAATRIAAALIPYRGVSLFAFQDALTVSGSFGSSSTTIDAGSLPTPNLLAGEKIVVFMTVRTASGPIPDITGPDGFLPEGLQTNTSHPTLGNIGILIFDADVLDPQTDFGDIAGALGTAEISGTMILRLLPAPASS